jgi:hypothetical protein
MNQSNQNTTNKEDNKREMKNVDLNLSFDNFDMDSDRLGKQIVSDEDIIINVNKNFSEESDTSHSDEESKKNQVKEMLKLQKDLENQKRIKISNLGTQNSSFRNTDISMRKNFDKNVNISGIKKNFSYDLNKKFKDKDTLKVDYVDEGIIKKRVRKLSQEILELNRKDNKNFQKRLSDFKRENEDNVDLSSIISSSGEKQKTIQINSSFKSNNHKDFLVKINMIGDLNAGKSEFVNIVTESQKPSKNKKMAKKACKRMNKKLTKKE